MISGKIVSTKDFTNRAYLGKVARDTPLYWTNSTNMPEHNLFVFEIQRAAITSCMIPIDLALGELYLDQTYHGVKGYFNLRPHLGDSDFQLDDAEGELCSGRYVLIGGSSDVGWYHWILNWAPRLALVAELHPGLIADESVRFIFHRANDTATFKAIPRALGISDSRMLFINPEETSFYENLFVPTFPNQQYHFPWLLETQRSVLLRALGLPRPSTHPKRIWIARENLPGEKRKAQNFDEIASILSHFGIVPIVLETLTFAEQIEMFSSAELVVGIHGAGLANMLFCEKTARILILDNERNLNLGMSRMFSDLAVIFSLRHVVLSCEEHLVEGSNYAQFGILHNRNFVVNPAALQNAIEAVLNKPSSS